MLYRARILQKNNGFSGELMRGRVIEYQLDGYATDGKAIYALNDKINEYNSKHGLAIPHVSVQNYSVTYETDEPEDEIVITQSPNHFAARTKPSAAIPDNPSLLTGDKALSDKPLKTENQDKGEAKTQKSAKPKRKPFTPYGLNGYLVDKQGNVRLMLDRRASAQTIMLNPEMFAALAEMVQRTQEQQNAIPE